MPRCSGRWWQQNRSKGEQPACPDAVGGGSSRTVARGNSPHAPMQWGEEPALRELCPRAPRQWGEGGGVEPAVRELCPRAHRQ